MEPRRPIDASVCTAYCTSAHSLFGTVSDRSLANACQTPGFLSPVLSRKRYSQSKYGRHVRGHCRYAVFLATSAGGAKGTRKRISNRGGLLPKNKSSTRKCSQLLSLGRIHRLECAGCKGLY